MALDLMKEKGVPLEQQLMSFNWRDMVRVPVSKLDDDAFTKVRIILMNGIESSSCVSSTCAAVCIATCSWR
jgi:hypothetical protein